MRHCLNTHPETFGAILDGRKRFEVRVFDRPFKLGDELLLQEYVPPILKASENADGFYTGRELLVVITYICPPGSWGLPSRGVGVLGIAPTPEEER